MKKPHFADNEIYHVYNRGVEKRSIFQDDTDKFRFIHDLFEFNDQNSTLNLWYRFNKFNNSNEVEPHYIERQPRERLVDILAFCLMPNHYHLLLQQRVPNGIVQFMQKLGTGYTIYFNKKYNRVGSLFQGRFKATHVNKDAHFIHLPFYIHLNPLDLIIPDWREREIKNYKKAMQFLEAYRWSSFLDYIGKKNFPSVTQREFLLHFFNGPNAYKSRTIAWLKAIDLESIKEVVLD
jgi:putative transposase